mmetsp:Transcript_20581/g.33510  ORF Transcript_20581/g.33510 Transcript_20581/m.33510 type:complete len:221 (-) Transcript_20581:27-689(-)
MGDLQVFVRPPRRVKSRGAWLSHYEYKIDIVDRLNQRSWAVCKRYSEFRRLYKTVESNCLNTDGLPKFPGKTIAASGRFSFVTCGTELVLDERQQAFQSLLDWAIRGKANLGEPVLLSFLCVPASIGESEGKERVNVGAPLTKQEAKQDGKMREGKQLVTGTDRLTKFTSLSRVAVKPPSIWRNARLVLLFVISSILAIKPKFLVQMLSMRNRIANRIFN